MKRILVLSGMLIFGCRSSPEVSFNNLTKAFISWHFRYQPVESSRFNMPNHHGEFKLYEISGRDEYYADISRFLIELSQVDATKISHSARVDYNILYSRLERMKYVMDHIRPWEWDPLWIVDEISDGIYILSERVDFDMDIRVESVQSRLEAIPSILDQSKNTMTAHSLLHITYAIDRIEKLLILIEQLPLKLHSDNITLDKVDLLINKAIESLQDYKNWLDTDAKILDKIDFPADIHLMPTSFSYYNGVKYMPEPVYQLAEKKMIPTQDRLFNLALPMYLIENDEPVWMDRDDTLEVISWSIKSINEDLENKVGNTQVLSQFYESITGIEQFVYNKPLLVQNKSKTIQLEFAPNYHTSFFPIFLFDQHPKEIEIDVRYNIEPPVEDYGYYSLTRHEIDIVNAKNIVPGYEVQAAYARDHPSIIRYIFPDQVTVAGWQAYSVKMLINEGYGNWEDEYHIYKLKEELAVIISAIVEYRYYNGQITREAAITYYEKMAFMNKREAEITQMRSDLNYFSGTQSFIGFMGFNSLLNEYKRKHSNNFNIGEFHREVLSNGIIPLYELKKIIFSP